jgi:hypothetical protein
MGYVATVMSLSRGDAQRSGRLVDSLLASDTTRIPPFLRGLLAAAKGWQKVVAGDTLGGLKEMGRVLEQPLQGGPFLAGPVRLQYAALLASRPDTRQQGIALLRYGFDTDIALMPLANFALARAYEKAGDKANAAEAYSRFLHQWNKADESAKPRVEEAKEPQRLTGEAKGG